MKNSKETSRPKRYGLSIRLKDAITGGKFAFGEKLPPIQVLSEMLGTNYVTMSRALHDLASEGFIECRNGVGNFVKYLPGNQPAYCKKVQIVIEKKAFENDYNITSKIVAHGQKIFPEYGWDCTVCPVARDSQELQRVMNNPEAYSVVFGLQPYLGGITANLDFVRKRIVLLGEIASKAHINTIIADEPQMIRLAVEHLHEQGYTSPCLILCSHKSPVETIFSEAFYSYYLHQGKDIAWCSDHCFSLHLDTHESYLKQDIVSNFLHQLQTQGKLEKIDSFLCPGSYWSTRFASELKAMGATIPGDIGLISLGDDDDNLQYDPSITSIDNNLEEHISFSAEILEALYAGLDIQPSLFCVTPSLTVRKSTLRKNVSVSNNPSPENHPGKKSKTKKENKQ